MGRQPQHTSRSVRRIALAIVQRIVLGPPVLHAILLGQIKALHDLDEELGYIRHMITRAEDGVWFIDYLRHADLEMDEPSMYCDLLEKHKRSILSLAEVLDRTGRLSSVAMKVSWLSRYHNDIVTDLSDSYVAYGLPTRGTFDSDRRIADLGRLA